MAHKKSFIVVETTVAGIQIVAGADTKKDAEAALERVRHQWPPTARYEILEVPRRGPVSAPNPGTYSKADLKQLRAAKQKEDRRLRAARVAAGEEV